MGPASGSTDYSPETILLMVRSCERVCGRLNEGAGAGSKGAKGVCNIYMTDYLPQRKTFKAGYSYKFPFNSNLFQFILISVQSRFSSNSFQFCLLSVQSSFTSDFFQFKLLSV